MPPSPRPDLDAWILAAVLAAALVSAGCLGTDGGTTGSATDGDGEGVPPPDPVPVPAENGTRSPEGNRTGEAAEDGGFSDTHVFPGDYEIGGNRSKPLDPGPYEIGDYRRVNLTSDVDGARLPVAVALPDVPAGTEVPVIAMATPYLQVVDPRESPDTTLRKATEGDYHDHHSYAYPLIANHVPHGYAVALVPVRGTADAGGCADLWGPKETADIDQVATWLGTRNWSDGNVGFFGLSYDGAAAWEAAATGNEHVETIVPVAGVPDAYEFAYPNGSFDLPSTYPSVYQALSVTLYLPPFDDPARTVRNAASRVVCPSVVRGLAAAGESQATAGPDSLGYWDARNQRPEVEARYDGSVFSIHGLEDGTVPPNNHYPWTTTLEDDGITVKHMIGQWGHDVPDQVGGDARRWDFAEILLHWFDYWLKGNHSVDLGPRVQVEDDQGRWRSADAWPPEDASAETRYLGPDGALTPTPPSGSASIPVAADPVPYLRPAKAQPSPLGSVAECGACALFATEPLAEPLRFAGRPHLDVVVTPSAPTGSLSASLQAVGPDGSIERMAGGQIHLRVADGGRTPEPVVPGEPLAVNLTLDPADEVVPEGHRIQVVVAQSVHGDASSFHEDPAPMLLEVGGVKSSLTLQTFEVSPDAFFTPPGGDGG